MQGVVGTILEYNIIKYKAIYIICHDVYVIKLYCTNKKKTLNVLYNSKNIID